MNCFSCFQSQRSKKSNSKREHGTSKDFFGPQVPETKKQKPGNGNKGQQTSEVETGNIEAQSFTFRELATATKNFRQECLLGEGGFGRVFKGTLAFTGQVVAIKQLDRNGVQGNKEFLGEVLTLSLLHHPNLVNLIGYCADGDQRLLVYEFMSRGSVEDHLLDIKPDQKPLDWFARMKIAFGAAKGLEHLHEKANPPVIYRDLKPSNILLDEDFTPKLSDFGLANLGPSGDRLYISSSRVMGTYGYCAPEYARSNELTTKSDVYSFGVVLLELISGRRAIDTTKPNKEQNLVSWAQPFFRNPKRFPDMADPILNNKFPEKDLNQAVAIAAMCLQEESAARPLMSDVVTALSFLLVAREESILSPMSPSTPPSEEKIINHNQQDNEGEDSSDNEETGSENDQDEDSSDHEDSDGENNQNPHRTKRDISDHDQDDESIDYDDGDSGDNGNEGSVDEHEDAAMERKKWGNSSMRSTNESLSTSHRSSKRLSNKIVSLRHKNNSGSHDGSVPLSDDSSGVSPDDNAYLSAKSRKQSLHALSHKSSQKSDDETGSLSHRSSRRSQNGDRTDSKGREEETVSSSL